MDSKSSITFLIVFFLGSLIALAFNICLFSPISPDILEVPSASFVNSIVPPNTHLQEWCPKITSSSDEYSGEDRRTSTLHHRTIDDILNESSSDSENNGLAAVHSVLSSTSSGVTKIGEGHVKDPEDVCVDKEGTLYTASRDGWIKRLQKDGSFLEDWKWINSTSLLGLAPLSKGGIVVCDTEEGLLKVDEDGVTSILSQFNGSKLWFADDIIEGKDGSLYFSIASTKFGLHNWYLALLEAKPYGQLLKYNPQTKETSLLLDNLYFANGVALSSDQRYLLVCETFKFRCLKYWLEGDLQGTTEIFIDNLPGAPDNINLAPDGSFWIAVLQLASKNMEFVHKSKIAKHLIATFPKMMKIVQGSQKRATVIKVSEDGKILKRFDDPVARECSFVTSAVEYEGNLYLGSLNANFVGKLPLDNYKD